MGEAGTATLGRVQAIFSIHSCFFVDAQMMLLLRDAFTHRCFYTKWGRHTEMVFTQRDYSTKGCF